MDASTPRTSSAVALAFVAGLGAGAAVTALLLRRRTPQQQQQPALADDECQSLFYDTQLAPDGRGLPLVRTVSKEPLYTVKPEYRFLPKEFYAEAVNVLPTVCVDIIVQRVVDGKVLLLHRRDPPVKGVWWWVGGRAFKGETFYATATRKVVDETGVAAASVSLKGMVHVWNTMFPTSAWDTGRPAGYAGCHTVNIVVVCTIDAPDISVGREQRDAWAVAGHRWISVDEGMVEGSFDKYVRLNLVLARQKQLLM